MKLFIKLIILFALASLIGYVFSVNNGHVSIYIADYRYDISLLFFALILILGYVFFLIVIKLLIKVISIPALWDKYRQKVLNNRIEKMQFEIINTYLDGDYKKATLLSIKLCKRNLSIKQRTLLVKIGYLSSKLANLENELNKFEEQITMYKLDIAPFIDFADMQINFYHQHSGLLNDNLDKVLSTNKKDILANLIKQRVTK